MQNKFYAIALVSLMLVEIFSVSFAISLLVKSVTIANHGRIGVIKAPITHKSEIRGLFIHCAIFGYSHNWTALAQLCANYGINSVFIEMACTTRPFQYGKSEWSAAINAFHSYGIKFNVVWDVVSVVNPPQEYWAVRPNGSLLNYCCPSKIKEAVEQNTIDIVTNFTDIDGIMLDYIRYTWDECYCDICKAAFEQWLGEGPITDWTPFLPDGSRINDYYNWRNEPISELVKIIHDTAKAIKPDIVISEAAWTYFSDCPIYWRKFIGQDTGRWIKEGWIDMVVPMMYTWYTTGKDGLEDYIDSCLHHMTGGVEGKVTFCAFLTTYKPSVPEYGPDDLAQLIAYVRQRGLDGYIIWYHPGNINNPQNLEAWLAALDNSADTFQITNIQVSAGETEATITWITDLPATSIIEYNTSDLFTASWEYWGGVQFPFWHIYHIQGNIVENLTLVTEHSITLTGLAPQTKYFFRIQSGGSGGNATSQILNFTTK